MISPIASAMRPETPVSISSKRMVGSCIRRASSALSASMTRKQLAARCDPFDGGGRRGAVRREAEFDTVAASLRQRTAVDDGRLETCVGHSQPHERGDDLPGKGRSCLFARAVQLGGQQFGLVAGGSDLGLQGGQFLVGVRNGVELRGERSLSAISSPSSAARCFWQSE